MLRGTVIVAGYLVLVVLGGSLLGYLLSTLLDFSYEKLLSRSILLLAALGLVPLWRYFGLTAQYIGLAPGRESPETSYRRLLLVYAAGIAAMLPPTTFFVVVGFRVWDVTVTPLSAVFLGECLIIFLSAWLVAIFEETLFRGVLYSALKRSRERLTTSPRAAFLVPAVISSLAYAAVHFLQPAEATLAEPGWWSGFAVVASAFAGMFGSGGDWQSFVGLTLLGVTFCWVRQHLGLWSAIALHSAFVCALRIFKELTIRDIVHPYARLVGEYDHFVGVVVIFWLIFGFVWIALYQQHSAARQSSRFD
ncbi:MAG: CPBP family intramembrane glutamic endopeptidase [Pseudomonadales bacterium]